METTTMITGFGLFIVFACMAAWVSLLISDYMELKRNKKFSHIDFYKSLSDFNNDPKNHNISDL